MSMILSAVPDPQAQLRSLQQELSTRNRQIADLEARLKAAESSLQNEMAKNSGLEAGARALQTTLGPLYNALKMIHGEIDAMEIDTFGPGQSSPRSGSPAWDSWKTRLGGAAAKIIDILMLHGELTQDQIRIHVGTSRMQTIYDAVSKLNKAGVINKRDGKISLKEL